MAPADCFICKGLTETGEWASREVVRRARRYEFRTFAVGLTLPQGVQEREDEIRAALKMKGGETIKLQISKEIADGVARETRKRVDRLKPDLTAHVDLARMEVDLYTKPLFYRARYTKPRGVAQRRELCPACGGAGCERCQGTGQDSSPSVEGLLRKRLALLSGTENVRMTWMGSEDADSEVSAPGRPLVIELKNPVRRRLPRAFRLRSGRGWVALSQGKVLPSKPARLPSFKFRTRILVELASQPTAEGVRGLKGLTRGQVRFDRPHGRPVFKRVHRVSAVVHGRRLWIDAELDGGLPVKRFVSGELVSPSVSEVLGVGARCRRFDILRVTETGRISFAGPGGAHRGGADVP